MLSNLRPDPNEIRDDSVRRAILAIRGKSDTNPVGALTLLIAFRESLLMNPAVQALPQPWAQPRISISRVLAEPGGATFVLLEDDVLELIKRAEAKKIGIAVTDYWEEKARTL